MVSAAGVDPSERIGRGTEIDRLVILRSKEAAGEGEEDTTNEWRTTVTTGQPPDYLQLDRFVAYPREDIDVEYKGWLDLREERDRATLAKAAIALANHGGGYIVLGFDESQQTLRSVVRPPDIPETTQDAVNAAIRRYADPEYHCQLYAIVHPHSGVIHPVIRIPSGDVPVMSKRSQTDSGMSQYKLYVRKPGPRSEEPHTAEEWRRLVDRSIRARREDLLDAVRSIFLGQTEAQVWSPEPMDALAHYCTTAYERWKEVVSILPTDAPARFPLGYYELGFALVGATPITLPQLDKRLAAARSIAFSGWPPFLEMDAEWAPYPYDGFIEAWVGRPTDRQIWNDPFHADFWRASVDGMLYTIRGYIEDGELAEHRKRPPGTEFTNSVPCIKIAEGLLFASRLAAEYEGVEQIVLRCRFTGLKGRSLLLVDHPAPFIDIGPVIHDPEVILTGQVSIQQVHDNLTEVIHSLARPLYERFGFYEIPISHVQSMLMKTRRYR